MKLTHIYPERKNGIVNILNVENGQPNGFLFVYRDGTGFGRTDLKFASYFEDGVCHVTLNDNRVCAMTVGGVLVPNELIPTLQNVFRNPKSIKYVDEKQLKSYAFACALVGEYHFKEKLHDLNNNHFHEPAPDLDEIEFQNKEEFLEYAKDLLYLKKGYEDFNKLIEPFLPNFINNNTNQTAHEH